MGSLLIFLFWFSNSTSPVNEWLMIRNLLRVFFRYFPIGHCDVRHGSGGSQSGPAAMRHASGKIGANMLLTGGNQKKMPGISPAEKGHFLLPEAVPFGRPAPYSGHHGHPLGKSVSAMKAQLARFVISLIAMFIGLIAFWEFDAGWIPAAFVVISGFIVSDVVFRRLADRETLQRDLEERVRNQHL